MTDGKNTKSYGSLATVAPFDGIYHWEEETSDANRTTNNLCNNVKTDSVTIYTIAFEVTDTATQAMLSSCASDPSKYYDAGSATELMAAFNGIGKELSSVRISH